MFFFVVVAGKLIMMYKMLVVLVMHVRCSMKCLKEIEMFGLGQLEEKQVGNEIGNERFNIFGGCMFGQTTTIVL